MKLQQNYYFQHIFYIEVEGISLEMTSGVLLRMLKGGYRKRRKY